MRSEKKKVSFFAHQRIILLYSNSCKWIDDKQNDTSTMTMMRCCAIFTGFIGAFFLSQVSRFIVAFYVVFLICVALEIDNKNKKWISLRLFCHDNDATQFSKFKWRLFSLLLLCSVVFYCSSISVHAFRPRIDFVTTLFARDCVKRRQTHFICLLLWLTKWFSVFLIFNHHRKLLMANDSTSRVYKVKVTLFESEIIFIFINRTRFLRWTRFSD